MRRLRKSGASCALMALILFGLGACEEHEKPASVASLPPLPPPPPPPAPSADDELQVQLANLGATSSDGGWSVVLSSATFRGGKVAFSPEEQTTIENIAALLKDSSQLRVQIENYVDIPGAEARVKELSQMHANAILRALASSGVEEGRIQAQGEVDRSKKSRIEIIFSNAEGEFRNRI